MGLGPKPWTLRPKGLGFRVEFRVQVLRILEPKGLG